MRDFLNRFTRDVFTIGCMIVLVGITVAVLLVHLTNEFRIAQIGYNVATATSEHRTLIEDHRRLKVEAALLGRTDHVAAARVVVLKCRWRSR